MHHCAFKFKHCLPSPPVHYKPPPVSLSDVLTKMSRT